MLFCVSDFIQSSDLFYSKLYDSFCMSYQSFVREQQDNYHHVQKFVEEPTFYLLISVVKIYGLISYLLLCECFSFQNMSGLLRR